MESMKFLKELIQSLGYYINRLIFFGTFCNYSHKEYIKVVFFDIDMYISGDYMNYYCNGDKR
jgi:hypothetical protein